MTIREIFIKADAGAVNNFFCDVPIKELRDELAFKVCRGLQYFAEHGIHIGGEYMTESDKQTVFVVLGINDEDQQTEEKLNAYLDKEVEMSNGETVNDTAIRLMWEMEGMNHFHLRYIDRIRATTDHATLCRWLQEVEGR